MSGQFTRAMTQVETWVDKAMQRGWLPENAAKQLHAIETQRAEELFSASGERPLLVAFFGGTGAGKSSLLNRLAGENIARTGVVRPTSREVTLYVHRDFQLRDLPTELPKETAVIAYHDDDSRRMLAWLDLPDIDSTATEHRELVAQWLPYCDWLIYVVTPERYHDDIGWRFIQQRQQHHSWLFVMNHWDEGNEAQIADFRQRLEQEGFVNPVILRTDCSGHGKEDDFLELEQTVNRAIRQYGLGFLQALGQRARLQELGQHCATLLERLGNETQWSQFCEQWAKVSDAGTENIQRELTTSARALGQKLLGAESTRGRLALPWRASGDDARSELEATSASELTSQVWNRRSQGNLDDLGVALSQVAVHQNLPVKAVSIKLGNWAPQAGEKLNHRILAQVDEALLTPGSRLQRGLYRTASALSWLLPLGAAGWAGWHLLNQFYLGTQGAGQFLGIDFAIHSLLLIVVGWLVPWLLQARLKPSLANAVRQGLLEGIRKGSEGLKQGLAETSAGLKQDRDALAQEMIELRQKMSGSIQDAG